VNTATERDLKKLCGFAIELNTIVDILDSRIDEQHQKEPSLHARRCHSAEGSILTKSEVRSRRCGMPPDQLSHEPDGIRESAPQLGQQELAWLIAPARRRVKKP
jgi:hypothetical protein